MVNMAADAISQQKAQGKNLECLQWDATDMWDYLGSNRRTFALDVSAERTPSAG